MEDPLNWDASYAVAVALLDRYPEVDLKDVSLEMVQEWVLGLPNFDDDPELANDEVLFDIYNIWLEEKLEGEIE